MSKPDNLSKFDKAVKNKAHERVQARITKLRVDLAAALMTFGVSQFDTRQLRDGDFIREGAMVRIYLENILSEKPHKGWPPRLWEDEEKQVAEELLAIMDPLQRAMNTKEPGPDDCSPEQKDSGAQSEGSDS